MKKKPVCPVCQSPKIGPLFKKFKRSYLACLNCGLEYVFPFPNQKEIESFYQKKFWEEKSHRGKKVIGYLGYQKEKGSFLTYFRAVLNQVENTFPQLSGKVLDVGCGQGLFLKMAQKKGWEVYGLDLSTEAIKQAQKELGVKTIFRKPIEKANLKADSFDFLTSFQTIEHLTDPEEFLKAAWRALKPGGVVLLATPDAQSFQSKIMGKSWFSYRHPDHLLFFNFQNLSRLLRKTGFKKIKKLKDPARKYPLAYLLKISEYYHHFKPLSDITKLIRKIIGPLGGVKIPIPLGSLVVIAQKK